MARVLPTSMRLDPDVKAGLDKAAKAEDRSVSNLVERILRAWLVEHGHMPKSSTVAGSDVVTEVSAKPAPRMRARRGDAG